MTRWLPGAPQRLQEAAYRLAAERGFQGIGVAEIASAAGLTERTFFRHFPDKQDVFFSDHRETLEAFRAGMRSAPIGASVGRIIERGASRVSVDLNLAARRPVLIETERIITSSPSLAERRQYRLLDIAAAITDEIQNRGCDGTKSSLAGVVGAALWQTSYRTWLADPRRSVDAVFGAVWRELHVLSAPA